MAESAWGIDHGEFEKGIADAAGTARLTAKAGAQSFKLGRLHAKKALGQAGYRSGVGGFKDAFSTGMKGNSKGYAAGRKQALRGARKNAKADISDITQGRQPGRQLMSPGSADIASAGFKRSMSNIDTRLKLR